MFVIFITYIHSATLSRSSQLQTKWSLLSHRKVPPRGLTVVWVVCLFIYYRVSVCPVRCLFIYVFVVLQCLNARRVLSNIIWCYRLSLPRTCVLFIYISVCLFLCSKESFPLVPVAWSPPRTLVVSIVYFVLALSLQGNLPSLCFPWNGTHKL